MNLSNLAKKLCSHSHRDPNFMLPFMLPYFKLMKIKNVVKELLQHFNHALICHCVENPVHVIGNSGVDPRDALGATRARAVADHAVLDHTY